ncbi:hypothetical protein KAW80_02635 [Candidatus Babeliales bacterium]|nr:hypothetical protein [Candidatus Babeliales bacterium]
MHFRNLSIALLLFAVLCLGSCSNHNGLEEINSEDAYDEYDDGHDDAYDKIAPQSSNDSYYMEGYKDGKKDLDE